MPENNIVIVTDYLSGSRQDKTGKHGFRPEMLERELDEVTLYSEKNLKQQQQKKNLNFLNRYRVIKRNVPRNQQ